MRKKHQVEASDYQNVEHTISIAGSYRNEQNKWIDMIVRPFDNSIRYRIVNNDVMIKETSDIHSAIEIYNKL